MYFIVNRVVSGEIYIAGKNFTLPLAVTASTNLISGVRILLMLKVMIRMRTWMSMMKLLIAICNG